MAQVSLIDRWISRLRDEQTLAGDDREQLLAELKKDYRDELLLGKMLEVEAAHLPYAHLKEAALQLAGEKKQMAETLEKMIVELGGSVNSEEVDSIPVEATGEFTENLKLENELGERLAEHANLAEDCGLEPQALLLLRLKDKHYNHQERIEELIMKTNGTL